MKEGPMKEYLRYIPPMMLGIATLSSTYFLLQFITPGIFSLNTIAPLATSVLFFAGLTVFSLPKTENWFRSKTKLKPIVYWLLMATASALAIYLILNGIATGGVEYTQYMAQQG